MTRHSNTEPRHDRIPAIDLARGIALMAMTVFHFSWDLEMFGVLERGAMAAPGPVWSARLIAGGFLFLVGANLYLAHGTAIRWPAFFKRLVMVGAAASAISLATWYATPDAFIFFGILHLIAFGSVAAVAFVRVPWRAIAAAGLFILLAGPALKTEMLDAPFWWWTGLSRITPQSNDYVPVFPFFGPILLGLAAAKFAGAKGGLARLRHFPLGSTPAAGLRFIGRHSLAYYLAHQPVMIAMLYSFLWLSGRI